MTRKVLFIVLIVGLAAALAGGYSMAYFTSKVVAPNKFTAGTVLIEAGQAVFSDGVEVMENWSPGQGVEATYNIENEGTKSIFLRALFQGKWFWKCETALARMNDDPGDFTYLWADHPWFSYLIHQPTSAKETFFFYAAQSYRVGEVDIWKDEAYLYINIRLYEGFELRESHINVQLDESSYRPPAAFGLWPYTEDHDPAATEFLQRIDWQDAWNGQELYIGIHGEVCAVEWLEWDPEHYDGAGIPIEVVRVESCDGTWRLGTDGYLYYVGEDDECLERVAPGDTVTLCVEVWLDETLIDNRYKNKKFELLVVFEAIQSTHGAAADQGWQFTCHGG